jgi:hypothetical protein
VEECAQIQQATPTRYVCNGKTYTSVQLADIRTGKTSDDLNGKKWGSRSAPESVTPLLSSPAPARTAQ